MINVNLVGNPNTGKTTLYNTLTSSNEHVGNWHGVTVEERAKVYKYKDKQIKLVDLPGIYSLTPLSYEEEVATKYILKDNNTCIINICDASNLDRNLYLTLGLMELGCPIILAINQIDKRPICKINYSLLEKTLGIKVVPVNASDKASVNKLNDVLLEVSKEISQNKRVDYNIPYIKNLDLSKTESYVRRLQEDRVFFQIKLLEDDETIKNKFNVKENFNKVEEVAQARYDYIEKVINMCCTQKTQVYGQSKLDKILLNRFLAFPIFLLFMGIAFYITFFSLGSWLSNVLNYLLDRFVGTPLIGLLSNTFGTESWFTGLVEVAFVGGLGSILSFLPQVALLFFFLSLLEDSGYLSRVAFVFDDILSKVGLSGKSIYTLLMGFGCSTTAVLTARNMEDKNSKIKTGLLSPYMSCSAKFPIYAVLGGAFFGASNIWVILGLYLLGIVVSIIISFILEKTVLKSKEQSFILEFPPYRFLSFKRTMKLLWQNIKMFVTRVATLILAMNVIVWLLSNFSFKLKYVQDGHGSILETLGRVLAPIFAPLGFNNWGLVSALIAGLVAKEVIVSSIAMFNGINDLSNNEIQNSLLSSSSVIFFANPCAVLSYLVFCLLYSPCLATTSVLSKEIGKKWTIIGLVIEFVVAYLVSLIVYNLTRIFVKFGALKVVLALTIIISVIISIIFIYKKIKGKKACPYSKNCIKDCKKK